MVPVDTSLRAIPISSDLASKSEEVQISTFIKNSRNDSLHVDIRSTSIFKSSNIDIMNDVGMSTRVSCHSCYSSCAFYTTIPTSFTIFILVCVIFCMIANHCSFQYEMFDVAAKFEGYYAVGADEVSHIMHLYFSSYSKVIDIRLSF